MSTLLSLISQSWPTESFVVCQNYQPPAGYIPCMISPLLDEHYGKFSIVPQSKKNLF